MIRIEGLRFRYPAAEGDFTLRIPRFDLKTGERLAITGPSGTGKTTLLKLIAGIEPPLEGSIWVDGQAVHAMSDSARRRFRITRLGFIFQDLQLLEYLDMADNILHPYRINPALKLSPAVRQRLRQLAADIGLEHKLGQPVTALSQGERQRVAICRAVLTQPALVLADEPTASLDPDNKLKILDVLFRTLDRESASLIAVTHDHELLGRFDRVIDFSDYHHAQA
ncbi:MAG: ATP-binding cassette domain-containing protein [Methylococcaceae bacterium]|nr:ATP-binding cassette domain-containing protein [Methylococcaceae bacterium]